MPKTGMPTSEPRTAEPRAVLADPAYVAALAAFAARHVSRAGLAGAVQAFHAVRALPYFSGADRTPLAALRAGRGACTAKHLVLRDLLRLIGLHADVALVECDFAAGVPAHATMPPDLRAQAGTGGVRDMHCWVHLHHDGAPLRLDATWPDALGAFGFPVNSDWAGTGDTRPAAEGGVVRAVCENILERKAELLAELSAAETARRGAFLKGLSGWLDTIQREQGGETP